MVDKGNEEYMSKKIKSFWDGEGNEKRKVEKYSSSLMSSCSTLQLSRRMSDGELENHM